VSPTDVEIDRALNALNVTLNDQRPDNPSVERLQQIADGATSQERKLHVRGEAAGRFVLSDGERVVAVVEREGASSWTVRREREAQGSHVARP
jgi:hypothetical protein